MHVFYQKTKQATAKPIKRAGRPQKAGTKYSGLSCEVDLWFEGLDDIPNGFIHEQMLPKQASQSFRGALIHYSILQLYAAIISDV